ncbi:MAG: hypothetical protein GX605_11275 [Chloroflexi bacterium]|nr:hypothetical protein [Chloroflexota bacterium]
MSGVRFLADALTLSRFALALRLVWLGSAHGAEGLPRAVVTLILAWATDLADGPLARLDREGRPSWVGRRDLEVDMSVSVGVLCYLTLSRYLPLVIGLSYLLMAAALLWRFRSGSLANALQALPYAVLLVLAARLAPAYALLAAAWLVWTMAVTWPRFPKATAPSFLRGMRQLGRQQGEPQDGPPFNHVRQDDQR